MIKIKIYATMAAAVLALAACTSDEETAPTGGQPQGAVTVSATIGSPLTRVNTEGDGGTFTPGDIIYVENLADGKVEGRDKGRYILQADGTTWQPCDEEGNVNNSLSVLWGTTNRFRGVYPATAAEGFTLPTDQSTEKLLRSADYMTCEDTEQYAMPQGGAASLSFSHRMAKLTLSLTLNSQYTGSETIDDVKLYLADGTTAITPCLTETAADGTLVYTAILNPADYTESSLPFCTVTVDGGTPLTARVPSGGITLEEGKAHTLNLRVGKNKIEMGTMTINEWGSTVGLEDKVAEEQPTVNTTTHTIRTTAEGQIAANTDWLSEAIGTSGILYVAGPMNQDDMDAIIAKKAAIRSLDLSKATGSDITITNGAFFQLSIIYLTLGSNVVKIGDEAFYFCANLTRVDLSGCTNLTEIGNWAFYADPAVTSITSLKLPENGKLSHIGALAFAYQTRLRTVSIPATISSLSSWVFVGCTSLTTIIFNGTEAPAMMTEGQLASPTNTFADCFSSTDNIANITIYLPNVASETEEWKAFFGESNGWTIKYGESPNT